jgi:SAM-dependent methyltransferase
VNQERAVANIPDRQTFESLYEVGAAWDVGRPQQVFIDVADQIQGSVLDAGCGTGDNALFLASRGCTVTGIDYLEEPIRRAKLKAAAQGALVTFRVQDATRLGEWAERFDNVIDSGLFHVFDDDDRKKYVTGLAAVLKPGGHLFLVSFSDDEPGANGPRRISQEELRNAFTQGWELESIGPVRFEVRPDLKERTFSPGGPKAWFAVIRRSSSA